MSTNVRGHRGSFAALSAAILLALYAPVSFSQQASTPAPDASASTAAADAAASNADPAAKQEKKKAVNLSTVTVTPTSFRDSLGKSLDIKRDSIGQVDTILAEDIGKFPDTNLAESLQRVPGVTITREGGEGRNISVRGLGPQFTRVRINGMEGLSTAAGTDANGGANRNRGFDFNVFASELFNKIQVRKTSSADVEEGSLGATVDLSTGHPFDYNGFTAVGSAQGSWNDLAQKVDPRFVGLISNTWGDGTFGALASIAYARRDVLENGHDTVRWDNSASNGGFNAASPYTPALDKNVFEPRIPRYGQLAYSQDRLGVTGSLQWQADDHTVFTLDGLYSDLDANRSENYLEAISFSRSGTGKPQTIVNNGAVDAQNDLVYGAFDNVDYRAESRYDEYSTEFKQLTLTGKHEFSDTFRLNGMVGYSESTLDNPIQTTVTLDNPNANGYSWDYRPSSRLPMINYGLDVTDPNNWQFANGLSEIRERPQYATNTYRTANLDAGWDINENFNLTGGLDWKKYGFDTTELRRASETTVPDLPAGTQLADLLQTITLKGLDVPAGTDKSWVAPNIDAFAKLFNIYCNCGSFAMTNAKSLGNNRSVDEEDSAAWLQGNFQFDLFGMPLDGNLGGRYVQTKQESSGFSTTGSGIVGTTVNRKYNDFLPSLNLVGHVTDDFLLRFGAAKVMARPDLGYLTPGVTVSVSGGSRTVSGGNPLLDPYRAKTMDFGAEWYFAPDSVLSAALFWKDIDSFVQTTRETKPYSDSGLPDSLLAGTGAVPSDEFDFTVPLNTPGGKLKGIELGYQQPFTFLPSFLSGFGTILNYTYVDSKIQYLTSSGADSLKTDLTGLSKNSYNATLYYDKGHLSGRISAAWRGGYLTTVPGRNNNDMEGTNASMHIDMQLAWRVNDHLEYTLDGINLTNEFDDLWVDSVANRVSVFHQTGRTYMLGVRFRN